MDNEETPFNCCFEYERRVEFSETDLAGIVHFSNFYRYMESAEHAFFRSLGHSVHETVDGQSIGWPRVQTSCEFFKPARFEDLLRIQICVDEVRSRSVRYRYHFLNESRDVVLAKGAMATVCVTINKSVGEIKATPIPSDLKAKLEAARESRTSE